ncbi:MAG: hypothetical protein EOO04_24965, partial [Chitinophagaceae bacterium]
MRCKWQISFLLILIPFGSISAQIHTVTPSIPEYRFQYLDNTNGLLHNEVNAITQDKRGYIWLGTPKGLQRYDGLRLQHYIDSTINAGESIIVAGLCSNEAGTDIWVRTRDWKIKKFNWLSQQFERRDADNIPDTHAKAYTDANGIKWQIAENRMHETDLQHKTITGYVTIYKEGEKLAAPAFMLKDLATNRTWISIKDKGLLLFDEHTGLVYSKEFNPLRDPLLRQFAGKPPGTWQMTADCNGNLWLYSRAALFYRYNNRTKKLSTYSLQQPPGRSPANGNSQEDFAVTCVIEDNHGVVWIGTENAGLLRFDPQADRFDVINHSQKNSPGINYTYGINFLYQDREENIWIGTDKGASIFSPYKNYFSIIRHEENNPGSLPKKLVSAVIETRSGDLLIGTSGGGISVYSKDWNFRKSIMFNEPEQNGIYSFLEDDDGKIWTGCEDGRIHILDSAGGLLNSIHPPELAGSPIYTMSKDQKGDIWFGSGDEKLVKWSGEEKSFIKYDETSDAGGSSSSPVNTIYIDHAGQFWITGFEGLRQFDPVRGLSTAVYLPQKNNRYSISAKNCFGITALNDSILVIGTGNGGLNFFNKNTKRFTRFSIDDKNNTYSAFAVRKDVAGDIWFTTDYDIFKLNPSTLQLSACNLEKGLMNSFFRPGKFYQTRSGQWITWTYAEVLGFYPDRIVAQEKNIWPVTITGFRVFDKPLFIDDILNAGEPVKLKHHENFISIDFASLGFMAVNQVKYYYRLTGIDPDWVRAGSSQTASYTKLEPGKYSFQVKT